MKYTLKSGPLVKTFKEVKIGEVFKYSYSLYIRTNEINGKDCCFYNAVLLETGVQTWFGEGYMVTDVGEYEIVPTKTKD